MVVSPVALLLRLVLPLYVVDQVSKWLVVWFVPQEEMIPVIDDFFYIVQVHNTGAAFGIMRDNNTFFIVLSIVALIAISVFWWRGAFRGKLSAIAAALIVAGILGNLTDRIVHGFVVDFLLFFLHVPFANPWPSFNVADSCISIAAVTFIVSSFFEDRDRPTAEA